MNRSSTRLETPSLSKIRKRKFFTVCWLSCNCSAISRLDNPWATPRTTCISRLESKFNPLASTARMSCPEANASTRIEICSPFAQIWPSCILRRHFPNVSKESFLLKIPRAPALNASSIVALSVVSRMMTTFRSPCNARRSRNTSKPCPGRASKFELMRRTSVSQKSVLANRPSEPERRVVTRRSRFRLRASASNSVCTRVSSLTSTRMTAELSGWWRMAILHARTSLTHWMEIPEYSPPRQDNHQEVLNVAQTITPSNRKQDNNRVVAGIHISKFSAHISGRFIRQNLGGTDPDSYWHGPMSSQTNVNLD